jgi:hypothetical protein
VAENVEAKPIFEERIVPQVLGVRDPVIGKLLRAKN